MLPPGAGRGWCAGLRVMALDGVHLDLPDTADNVAEFGRSVTVSRTARSRRPDW